jgi:hypothetical protein
MVLIAGGAKDGGSTGLASAELYDPAMGIFTATGSLPTARAEMAATQLNDGTALITGGITNSTFAATAEIYNPSSGAFTPTANNMSSGRSLVTATLLSNGMVLIAAGYNYGGPAANADLYNPATGTFSPTGSLATARYVDTATLLNNGMVLIAGGYGSSGYLASAELYNPSLDNDSQFSQLNGGNTFTGNQTVNGTVAATNFVGNGSNLSNVAAASLNCAGCVGNQQLSVNYAGSTSQGGPATNALMLGGFLGSAFQPAGSYATAGANLFSGDQNITGNLMATGSLSGSSVSSSTQAVRPPAAAVSRSFISIRSRRPTMAAQRSRRRSGGRPNQRMWARTTHRPA